MRTGHSNTRPATGRSSPEINQKGFDLRIGLDIARLSLTHRVEAIVVAGGSDFVPAFKFARREGIQVYPDSLGRGTKRGLRVHADGVIEAPLSIPPDGDFEDDIPF